MTKPSLLSKDMGVLYFCDKELEVSNEQVTALACDDSNDCDHGRCMARSESQWVTAQCIDERDNGAMGHREACRPGTCATKGTECRKGFACGFYGTLCERLAVCDAKPPPCVTVDCSAETPLCCVVDGKF